MTQLLERENSVYAIKGSKYILIPISAIQKFQKINGEISVIMNDYKIPLSSDEYLSIVELAQLERPELFPKDVA